LDQAVKLNKSLPAVYQSRGLVALLIGKLDGAEQDFSKAIELGVNDQLLYYNRGVARSMLGNKAGALQDYDSSCREGYVPACQFSKILSQIPDQNL
jgi:tetratricopeptide (TPR) repeat protein